MSALLNGFAEVLTVYTLAWTCVGGPLGYVLGVLPGLGKATGVAVAIPLTFYLQPVAAIALLIGIAQAIALVPGTSRSGITLSAGLALGLGRSDAAQFSFLMSIPVILDSSKFHKASPLASLPGECINKIFCDFS